MNHKIFRYLNNKFKYLAILPVCILLIMFTFYPLLRLFCMSLNFVTIEGGKLVEKWIGLNNYISVFQDKIFRIAFFHSLFYIFTSVPLEIIIAFLLAMLVSNIKKSTFYRTIFIIPLLIPPVVNGTMWGLMYNPHYGLINMINNFLGLPYQYWLSNSSTALMGVVVVSVWQWCGYSFLLLLAGLQSIPKNIFEAAKIDGANGLNLITGIVIPILKPIILITLMFRIIYAFKAFGLFYVLTGGGPGYSTEILNTYIQKVFMTEQRIGFGSAASVISILIIGIIATGFRKRLDL